MAEEQLDILRQGADVWNEWRYQHEETPIDLSKADLSGADLWYTDLNGANLNKVNFKNANLYAANLNGANLYRANLSGARLSFADLSGARLSFANLKNASLISTNLNQTTLNKASLRYTDLAQAIFKSTNLNEANLHNAIIGWTVFGDLDLRTVKGLETIRHRGPSIIGTDTLSRSQGNIPEIFLRGAGVEESFIEYAHALTRKPIEYYTCFISYSSKDELFARRIHNDLQQEGVRCWFAPEDINIGDKIKHSIDESIRTHEKLLLILSEHAIASSWVAYEVERALKKEPQGVPNVLYPVRVDKAILTCTTDWARDIKDDRHIGDFERWRDPKQYEESFKRLLRALNAKKEQLTK